MGKRHSDAIAIQEGAVNPSGIALSIVAACNEIRAGKGYTGTDQICGDPAVRLMVHQLAHITRADDPDLRGEYENCVKACMAFQKED